MLAVLGLGNPGPEYEDTRHNAGFILVDHLAKRWKFPAFRRIGLSRTSEGVVSGQSVRLIKPTTYMNRSGAAVTALRANAAFDPAVQLLVVVDEVALPIGRFRIRAEGSAGGHNGLKSIEGSLRSQQYPRLRIGVGPDDPTFEDLADFVLSPFEPEERAKLDALLDTMATAVETWVTDGIVTAMNRFNRQPKPQ